MSLFLQTIPYIDEFTTEELIELFEEMLLPWLREQGANVTESRG